MEWAAAWPERTWAVEGAGGLGHLLAQQLVAAGEQVLDIQPKLGARVRLLSAGRSGKSDPNDARSVAIAALRSPVRRAVVADDHAAVLKMWAKRHRDLARLRCQAACRLHAVLCEMIPGGVSREITAPAADALLASLSPAGAVQAARHQLAAEHAADLRDLDAKLAATRKTITAAVRASGTSVTSIFGVGPIIAATILGDVPDPHPVPRPRPLRRLQRHRPGPGLLREQERLPAVAARQPAAQPRHPHGRRHPGPQPAQRRPRLIALLSLGIAAAVRDGAAAIGIVLGLL